MNDEHGTQEKQNVDKKRDGVRALGEWLAAEHGVEHRFVDIDNPA